MPVTAVSRKTDASAGTPNGHAISGGADKQASDFHKQTKAPAKNDAGPGKTAADHGQSATVEMKTSQPAPAKFSVPAAASPSLQSAQAQGATLDDTNIGKNLPQAASANPGQRITSADTTYAGGPNGVIFYTTADGKQHIASNDYLTSQGDGADYQAISQQATAYQNPGHTIPVITGTGPQQVNPGPGTIPGAQPGNTGPIPVTPNHPTPTPGPTTPPQPEPQPTPQPKPLPPSPSQAPQQHAPAGSVPPAIVPAGEQNAAMHRYLGALGPNVNATDKNQLAQPADDVHALAQWARLHPGMDVNNDGQIKRNDPARASALSQSRNYLSSVGSIWSQITDPSGPSAGKVDRAKLLDLDKRLTDSADTANSDWSKNASTAANNKIVNANAGSMQMMTAASLMEANAPIVSGANHPIGTDASKSIGADQINAVAKGGDNAALPVALTGAANLFNNPGVFDSAVAANQKPKDKPVNQLAPGDKTVDATSFAALVKGAPTTPSGLMTTLQQDALNQAVDLSGSKAGNVKFSPDGKTVTAGSAADKAAALVDLSNQLGKYQSALQNYSATGQGAQGMTPSTNATQQGFKQDIATRIGALTADPAVQQFMSQNVSQQQGLIAGSDGALHYGLQQDVKNQFNSGQLLQGAFDATQGKANGLTGFQPGQVPGQKPATMSLTDAMQTYASTAGGYQAALGGDGGIDAKGAYNSLSPDQQGQLKQAYAGALTQGPGTDPGQAAQNQSIASALTSILPQEAQDQATQGIAQNQLQQMTKGVTLQQALGAYGINPDNPKALNDFIQQHMSEIAPPGSNLTAADIAGALTGSADLPRRVGQAMTPGGTAPPANTNFFRGGNWGTLAQFTQWLTPGGSTSDPKSNPVGRYFSTGLAQAVDSIAFGGAALFQAIKDHKPPTPQAGAAWASQALTSASYAVQAAGGGMKTLNDAVKQQFSDAATTARQNVDTAFQHLEGENVPMQESGFTQAQESIKSNIESLSTQRAQLLAQQAQLQARIGAERAQLDVARQPGSPGGAQQGALQQQVDADQQAIAGVEQKAQSVDNQITEVETKLGPVADAQGKPLSQDVKAMTQAEAEAELAKQGATSSKTVTDMVNGELQGDSALAKMNPEQRTQAQELANAQGERDALTRQQSIQQVEAGPAPSAAAQRQLGQLQGQIDHVDQQIQDFQKAGNAVTGAETAKLTDLVHSYQTAQQQSATAAADLAANKNGFLSSTDLSKLGPKLVTGGLRGLTAGAGIGAIVSAIQTADDFKNNASNAVKGADVFNTTSLGALTTALIGKGGPTLNAADAISSIVRSTSQAAGNSAEAAATAGTAGRVVAGAVGEAVPVLGAVVDIATLVSTIVSAVEQAKSNAADTGAVQSELSGDLGQYGVTLPDNPNAPPTGQPLWQNTASPPLGPR